MKNIALYKGDCLEIMKEIPDKSIDMILCDLPYGTTACKWDVVIPFDKLWEQYNRIIKDNGAIVLFGSEPFSSLLIASNIKNFKYDLIWEKTGSSGFLNAKKMPLRSHEGIYVFYKKPPTYNPQKWKVQEEKIDKRKTFNYSYAKEGNVYNSSKPFKTMVKKDDGTRYPRSIIKVNNRIGKQIHPTQKPVELLEYLILTYSNESETILDNCMGSGSTGVACINTGRKFLGIEKDDTYFDIAKERIENTYNELSK